MRPCIKTYLDEHLIPACRSGNLGGRTVAAHGLAITAELQSELLLVLGGDAEVAGVGQLMLVQSSQVGLEHVHLLHEDCEGGLRCLTDLLVDVLGLSDGIENISLQLQFLSVIIFEAYGSL